MNHRIDEEDEAAPLLGSPLSLSAILARSERRASRGVGEEMRLVFGRKESEGKCGKVVVVRLRSGIEREKERNRRERKCGIECSFEKEERDLKKKKKINKY